MQHAVIEQTHAPLVSPERRTRCDVLGIRFDAVDWERALGTALEWSLRRESRYICHANVHAVMTAARNRDFAQVLNESDLVTADGMPLVWVMRQRGFRAQPRLSGPDFMWRFCGRAAMLGLRIYLYGGTPETLGRLQERLNEVFPEIRIVGVCSPPFRPMSAAEQDEIVARINESGANAVFVSLGCPKQERWMAEQRGRISAVMFGVGAAFGYHAGTIRRAPPWMQARGLEWLHRLVGNPRRLWRRYLVTNSLFVVFLAWDFLRSPFSRSAESRLQP